MWCKCTYPHIPWMWPQQKGYRSGCTGGRWLRLYRDTVQWRHHMCATLSQERNTRRGNKRPRLRDDSGSPAGAEDTDVTFRRRLEKTQLFGLLLMKGVWSKNYRMTWSQRNDSATAGYQQCAPAANISSHKLASLWACMVHWSKCCFFFNIYHRIPKNAHNCPPNLHHICWCFYLAVTLSRGLVAVFMEASASVTAAWSTHGAAPPTIRTGLLHSVIE